MTVNVLWLVESSFKQWHHITVFFKHVTTNKMFRQIFALAEHDSLSEQWKSMALLNGL